MKKYLSLLCLILVSSVYVCAQQIIFTPQWTPQSQFAGYYAAMEDAYIEVKSYGGDSTGLQIPFTLHYTGNRQKGYFDPDSRMFTPEEEEE